MKVMSIKKMQCLKFVTLHFFSKFLLMVIVFQLAVYMLQASYSVFIQSTIANAAGYIYRLFDSSIVIDGNLLIHQAPYGFLIVDNSCTGLMLLASVCAAVIAFDHKWQSKIKMLIIAIVILQSENIFRIAHLLYIVKNNSDAFEIFHLYIWQGVNFATALIVIFSLDKKFKGKCCR